MARPTSIQHSTILEAARRVFLQHGFKATTAQVAREAGISEGSLFNHFRCKNDLFLRAMQVESLAMEWHACLLKSVGTGDIRRLLEFAGLQLIERLQIIVPRMMAMRASGIPLQAGVHRLREVPPPVYHLRVLSRYFRAEIKQGRLVMRAPDAQAHAFIGALSHYVLCAALYRYRPAPPAPFVHEVVDTLLRAAAVERRLPQGRHGVLDAGTHPEHSARRRARRRVAAEPVRASRRAAALRRRF